MKRKILSFTAALAMIFAGTVPAVSSVYAEESDSIVFSSDFEDGVINDWTAFGGSGKLSLDSKVKHDGKSSLKITGRTQSFNGPSLVAESFFKHNETYSFNAWVYHDSDSVKTISWTLTYIDSLGEKHYTQAAGGDVEPGKWTEISGQILIPEDSMSSLLYFECANATVDFNIDDVSITGSKNEAEEKEVDRNGYLYSFDFENGNDNWAPRGDNRLIRTDEHSYTGSHSIYVTNRNKTWNGPTVNVNDIKRGISYFYSAYVMYTGEEYDAEHGFRMEIQYNLNGETFYQLIKEQNVQRDKWTRISGTFTLPENAADPSFYVQTRNLEEGEELRDSDLLSFYTDNVIISETSVIHGETALKVLIYFAAALAAALLLRLLSVLISKKMKERKDVLNSRSKDAMTQCLNRNAYENRLAEISKSPEQCKSLHFALCDVNFLKYINDNLGHDKGDEAITRCGQLLMNAVGSDGDVYRIGGDEFICITSESMKEKIRKAISDECKSDKGYPFAVASGFAEYNSELDGETPDVKAIIERSDKEMYADKQEIKSKNTEFSRK